MFEFATVGRLAFGRAASVLGLVALALTAACAGGDDSGAGQAAKPGAPSGGDQGGGDPGLSDPGGNAPAPAPVAATYCSDKKSTFCSDFDQPDALSSWQEKDAEGGATLTIEKSDRGTSALLAKKPAGALGRAAIARWVADKPKTLTCTFDVKPTSTGTATEVMNFSLLDGTSGEPVFDLGLVLGKSSVYMNTALHMNGDTAGDNTDVSAALPADAWTTVTMRLGIGVASVTVNGATKQIPVSGVPATWSGVVVDVGATHQQAPEAFEVRFDNVMCDAAQ